MALARFWRLLTRIKPINNDTSDSPLKRCLNVFDLTSLGVGATVGAGLYVVTGQIARDVAGPAVVLSFFIAAVAAFLAGICYAEFGCRITTAGSAYVYTYTSIGEVWAFIIGWNMVLEYVIGTASLGRASSEYLDAICGGSIHKFFINHVGHWHTDGFASYPDFLAFALVLIIAGVVSCGAKHSAVFNKVVTGINLIVVAFVICVGLFHLDTKNWSGPGQFVPYGVSGILAGAASCFYCFVGFDVIATASEETISPKKSIPLAIMLSLIISFLAYFGVATVLTLMVSYKDLDKIAPLPEAFNRVGLPGAKYVIAVGGLCALLASLLSGIFAVPRILYSMSNDGLIFSCFKRVYAKTNMPLISLASASMLAAVLSLLLDLKQLVEMLSIGTLLAYTLVAISVLLLRFQPGVESVVSDVEISSSEKSYRVICCRPKTEQPAIEYKPLSASNLEKDIEDEKKENQQPEPDKRTSQIATTAVVLIICSLTGLCALLVGAWEALTSGNAWAVFTACFMGILFIFAVMVMMLQPRNHATFPFTVPMIPFIPIASLTVNLFLLLKLSHWTWVRFGIWMVIGMSIYFFYGIRHSVESLPNENDSNQNDVLVQEMPGFSQTINPVQPRRDDEKAPLQDSFQDTPADEEAKEAGDE
ncbi:high affinity cationic amino acid transporter 1 [Nematostella vectensis]|nr:high affinity cationic amino acid transporter 1 [Nematostella vectensis]